MAPQHLSQGFTFEPFCFTILFRVFRFQLSTLYTTQDIVRQLSGGEGALDAAAAAQLHRHFYKTVLGTARRTDKFYFNVSLSLSALQPALFSPRKAHKHHPLAPTPVQTLADLEAMFFGHGGTQDHPAAESLLQRVEFLLSARDFTAAVRARGLLSRGLFFFLLFSSLCSVSQCDFRVGPWPGSAR